MGGLCMADGKGNTTFITTTHTEAGLERYLCVVHLFLFG